MILFGGFQHQEDVKNSKDILKDLMGIACRCLVARSFALVKWGQKPLNAIRSRVTVFARNCFKPHILFRRGKAQVAQLLLAGATGVAP